MRSRTARILCAALCSWATMALPATNDSNQDWNEPIARICGHTAEATTLNAEQLSKRVEDSEKLLQRLQGLDEPRARIYVFRLTKCRDFYRYMLELKQQD